MITNKSLQVARWEFVERAKKKSYIIGLILMPVIMVLFGAGPAYLEHAMADRGQEVLLVYDGTGLLYDSLTSVMSRAYIMENGTPVYRLQRIEAASFAAAKDTADAQVLGDRSLSALLIPPDAFDSLIIEFRAQNVSNVRVQERLESTVSDLIVEHKMEHAGLEPEKVRSLNRRAGIRSVRVTVEGEKETGFLQSFGLSYVFLIMLLILVLTSGQLLVRSMVEEKSNRIVEILVSSCSPTDLMFGKILGLSALGFVQVFVWGAIAVTVVLVTGVQGLPLENIGLLLVYFVLGFILYSALFVGLGCLVSTEQEAQQMTGYLSMFFTLPLVIAFVATQVPDSPVLVAITMIPLLTPSMMIMRIPVMTPPLWEIVLTITILIVSILVMVWIAGKIFRVGILLTGKRPSLDEIVRWIRS